VGAGDTLVFATDGISGDFLADVSAREEPQRLADQILARHGKGTDDALVLVARYLGPR
jgi:phosphoserine phosphatase RsbX